MNSFDLRAIGNLARNPETVAMGDLTVTRFCLVGSDQMPGEKEGEFREAMTSVWFMAWDDIGEQIAREARKGDQLILEATLCADEHRERQEDYAFFVTEFRFGAKRGKRDSPIADP